MDKITTTIRLSKETKRKLKDLAEWWGEGKNSRSAVISTCVDRVWQDEARTRDAKIDKTCY